MPEKVLDRCQYSRQKHLLNNTNMAKQIFEHLSDYFSQDSARKETELGLNHIDGTINGLPKGKLITVIGQSVDGRDILLNTLVKNIAVDQRIPSLILNLATSEDTFYNELISNINKVPIDDIRNGYILSLCKPLAKTEIYVDFSKDRSLEYLEKTIRHYVSQGVEMVFIDLFQAIDYHDNIDYFCEDELLFFKEKNSRFLYILAKDLHINIIIGAAVSYLVEEREGIDAGRPKLGDAMMAGRLDEYSDLILSVYVPYVHGLYYDYKGNCYRDVIEVQILKNKINNKMGRFSMKEDINLCTILDNTEYNQRLIEELREKNPAINDLVIGLGLELANNT